MVCHPSLSHVESAFNFFQLKILRVWLFDFWILVILQKNSCCKTCLENSSSLLNLSSQTTLCVHFVVALFPVVERTVVLVWVLMGTPAASFSGISDVASLWSWSCRGFSENACVIFSISLSFWWAHTQVTLSFLPCGLHSSSEWGNNPVADDPAYLCWTIWPPQQFCVEALLVEQLALANSPSRRRCVLHQGWYWVGANPVLNCGGGFTGWKDLTDP